MVVVNVDDTSSDISYAGTWYPGGSADEYGGTSHGVSVAGATATFSFTGTQVVVYGSVSNIDFSQAPVSTYSIDGGQQWTYVASPGPDNQYRVPFYKSPQLSQGTHTLVIKTTRPSTHYWLDYIQYSYDQDISAVPSIVLPPATSTSPPAQQNNPATTTPSNAAATQTTTASTGNSTPESIQGSGSAHSGGISNGTTVPGQTNGGNPTAIYSISVSTAAGSSPQATGSETTNSDVNSTSAGSSRVSRTGTIAGAVVGSLVLVATIVILVWLLARKRRRDSSSSPESSPHIDQAEPFASVPGGFGGYPHEGQMRKQAEMDHTPSNSGASQDAGDHPGLPAASDDMQPPPISVASLSGYHPPVDHDGQPYIVVYQPMPAEAPPSYRLRQSAATFAARES